MLAWRGVAWRSDGNGNDENERKIVTMTTRLNAKANANANAKTKDQVLPRPSRSTINPAKTQAPHQRRIVSPTLLTSCPLPPKPSQYQQHSNCFSSASHYARTARPPSVPRRVVVLCSSSAQQRPHPHRYQTHPAEHRD